MKLKICTKCSKTLQLDKYFEFRSDTKKYRNHCKLCNKGYKELREDFVSRIKKLYNEGFKNCVNCKSIKTLDEFGVDNNTLTGKSSYCKECKKNQYTKEQLRDFRLKSEYNISQQDYLKMYDNVFGKCQICKNYHEKLFIDHCHTTGKVRGLLCVSCNTAIGFLKDNINNLKQAIKYLEDNKK